MQRSRSGPIQLAVFACVAVALSGGLYMMAHRQRSFDGSKDCDPTFWLAIARLSAPAIVWRTSIDNAADEECGARLMSKNGNPEDYATLFLARAILEDDVAMTRAALEAGGSLSASWIDGRTSLLALPAQLGSRKVAGFLADRLAPEKARQLPVYRPSARDPAEEKYWSPGFVLFAARRGYDFHGSTLLQNGTRGSEMPPFLSVRSAVSKINTSWGRVDQVRSQDQNGGDRGSSRWRVEFGPTWNGDKKISGFEIVFDVCATEWDLFEAYRDGDLDFKHGKPDANHPGVDRQMVWQGDAIMERLIQEPVQFDQAVAAIAKGGNPFFKRDGMTVDQLVDNVPELRVFMARARELCAPEIGFHRRLAPHLTKASLRALAATSVMEAGTPAAKSKRATLAEGRTDTL